MKLLKVQKLDKNGFIRNIIDLLITSMKDLGPRTSDLGPRTSDLGPRTSDLGPRTSDFGIRTSDFRSQGTSLPIFHSLLLCTNMDDDVRRFVIYYSGTLRHGYNVKTRPKNYFFIPGRCRRSNLTNFGEVITMEIMYHSMQYHCHSNHN